ncbi:muskelin [Ischnura elegans]|uniref:muskelin n=1 Tax=Ischnura elegans TaxID=197161 RepID=UPI001ED8A07D|nr:muskelin [Ischnura elegans]
MAAFRQEAVKELSYSVHKCSSFSSTYVPENIQVDKPNDQSSRWSSDTNNPPQFLVLKLQKYSLVESITFGKYEKTHVCNLKKFKVYGGLQSDNMIELLESGLRNDSSPETFELRRFVGGHPLPIRYLKIAPLQSWGPSFNFSIWFIRISGIDSWEVVQPCIRWFNVYREREALRLCMKHLRSRGHWEALETLESGQGVPPLEDPVITLLHNLLVRDGDYIGAEKFVEQAAKGGSLFSQYIGSQEYKPIWQAMSVSGSNSDLTAPSSPGIEAGSKANLLSPSKQQPLSPRPGMRGGHQMVIDSAAETIYLFGGWDGNQDLSDLWSYHIPSGHWTLLSMDTEAQGGPSARSCHKVCLDPERRQLFTLGRYVDSQYRYPENLKSDFYVYDIERDHWTLITEDTASMGGPQLIFDHQMCMDVEKQTIYVFGGRVLLQTIGSADDRPGCSGLVAAVSIILELNFSGLFSYHIPTNTWTKLAEDTNVTGESCSSSLPTIRSRVGHSMLFHPGSRKLYIFAGQRGKEHLNDFFTYAVDTGEVEQIISDGGSGKSSGGLGSEGPRVPAAGFTQRATIDPELDEIYVLSGLSKDKEKRDDNVQNSFWVYYIKTNHWSCVYRNENTGEHYWSRMQHVEPCPRFAHQLVYDPVQKVHYLFGGNPGRSCLPKLRLDDFWQLRLQRPTQSQLLQRCKMMIRTHRFEELAAENKMLALNYLQTSLSEIVDHNDPEQTKEFQLMAAVLFRDEDGSGEEDCSSIGAHSQSSKEGMDSGDEHALLVATSECHIRRSRLFDRLVEFFPESMTQPRSNLIDLVPL